MNFTGFSTSGCRLWCTGQVSAARSSASRRGWSAFTGSVSSHVSRAIRRGGYYVMQPGQRTHLTPDPEVFPNLERLVRFEVNREGERGDEVPACASLYRTLVAGGSQPEGYLLDQETSWPGALQQLLNRPERLNAI